VKCLLPAAFIAVTALPVAAFDRMTHQACRASFERLTELIKPNDSGSPSELRFISVTTDRWCQITAGDPGFETASFTELEWRMDGTLLWTEGAVPPLGLQVRVRGLDPDEMQGGVRTDRPTVSVDVTLRQEPAAGQVIVERAVMQNDAGDSLAVSGVFERVFLSSPSMMQVSMGSATFKAGLMSMTLEGSYENPFGFYIDVEMRGVPQAQRDAAFDLISRLPDGLISDASRAEIGGFAGELPKPVGTLEVSVVSERGLGLMQIGSSFFASAWKNNEDDEMRNEWEILFDGLLINADWSPAGKVAE
jgi:hypothetical protein